VTGREVSLDQISGIIPEVDQKGISAGGGASLLGILVGFARPNEAHSLYSMTANRKVARGTYTSSSRSRHGNKYFRFADFPDFGILHRAASTLL